MLALEGGCQGGRVRCHRVFDGALSVEAGTLDDPSALAPGAHHWTQHKLSWVRIPDGVACIADGG